MTTEQILIKIVEEGVENDVYSLGWNGDVKDFEFLGYSMIDKFGNDAYLCTVNYVDNMRHYDKLIHVSRDEVDRYISNKRDNKLNDIGI